MDLGWAEASETHRFIIIYSFNYTCMHRLLCTAHVHMCRGINIVYILHNLYLLSVRLYTSYKQFSQVHVNIGLTMCSMRSRASLDRKRLEEVHLKYAVLRVYMWYPLYNTN